MVTRTRMLQSSIKSCRNYAGSKKVSYLHSYVIILIWGRLAHEYNSFESNMTTLLHWLVVKIPLLLVLVYTFKSSTFAYNSSSYMSMLISLCERKNSVWKERYRLPDVLAMTSGLFGFTDFPQPKVGSCNFNVENLTFVVIKYIDFNQ